MEINATPASSEANSYGTLAEAEEYFTSRLFKQVWDDLPDDASKEAALITATRLIEYRVQNYWDITSLPEDATVRRLVNVGDQDSTYVVWNGAPATNAQSLSWPRIGLNSRNGLPLSAGVVPKELKNLQFEIALLCSGSDRLAESQVKALGLSGLKAGPVDLRFNSEAPNPTIVPSSLFQALPRNWWYAFELVYHQSSKMVTL